MALNRRAPKPVTETSSLKKKNRPCSGRFFVVILYGATYLSSSTMLPLSTWAITS